MSEYDNTNRGVLFQNHKKKSDKSPDYTGKINVDGVDKEISAWIKQGRKGEFFSLSVKEPYQKPDTHKGFDSQGDIPQNSFEDDSPPF